MEINEFFAIYKFMRDDWEDFGGEVNVVEITFVVERSKLDEFIKECNLAYDDWICGFANTKLKDESIDDLYRTTIYDYIVSWLKLCNIEFYALT